MASTKNELITEAYSILGLLDPAQGLDSSMSFQGSKTLNLILKSLNNSSIFVNAIDYQTSTADSATFDTLAGTKTVDKLWIVIDGTEIELTKFTREEWDSINNKLFTGQPLGFFPSTSSPPVVSLYPVPDTTYNVKYRRIVYLNATTAEAVIDIPEGGEQMIVYILASYLAPIYGLDRGQYHQIAMIEKASFLAGQSDSWGTTLTAKPQRGIV